MNTNHWYHKYNIEHNLNLRLDNDKQINMIEYVPVEAQISTSGLCEIFRVVKNNHYIPGFDPTKN